jgi:site-specific DNA-methyltransferase (adenine-specific)
VASVTSWTPSYRRERQTDSISLDRVPKRPPRLLRELPVPHDLRDDGPTLAFAAAPGSAAHGELWHADVMELFGKLADGSVDLVVADPPYAIAKADWDEFESLDAYLAWCDLWLAEVERVLAPHGSAYVCGFSEILADVKARSARRFASCRWLVWYYRNKANLGRDWGRSHESILHLRKADARLDVDAIRIPYNGHTTKYPARVQAVSSQYGGASARRERWEPNPLGAKPRDVIELPVICNGMAEKTPHATQKPEALIEKLILASSAPGQLVVDPFVGSGTTAVVATRLGRSWLAGDGDPRFVGLARERLVAKSVDRGTHARPRKPSAKARLGVPTSSAKTRPGHAAESAPPRVAQGVLSFEITDKAGGPAPAHAGKRTRRSPA